MREPLLDDDGENRAVRAFLMMYGVPGCDWWVVYPTPGAPQVPTAVLSCPSEQSARSEARRLQSEYDRDNRLRLAFRSQNEDTGK